MLNSLSYYDRVFLCSLLYPKRDFLKKTISSPSSSDFLRDGMRHDLAVCERLINFLEAEGNEESLS